MPSLLWAWFGMSRQGISFWMNAVSTAMRAAAGASGTSHGAAPARRPATVPAAAAAAAAPWPKLTEQQVATQQVQAKIEDFREVAPHLPPPPPSHTRCSIGCTVNKTHLR